MLAGTSLKADMQERTKQTRLRWVCKMPEKGMSATYFPEANLFYLQNSYKELFGL
jgi:hypothetical protein